MYEECLDVFNSMSYSEHALNAGRANFDANYNPLREHLKSWKGRMQVKYGNSDMTSKFFKKMEDFMNHLLFLYDSLSPEGRADINYRSSFHFDEASSIYQKFFKMMKASPWLLQLYDNVNEMAQWKLDMTWMGKRLFCIVYYNDPHHLQQYKQVQEYLADENCQLLWDMGAPKWQLRRPPVASSTPRDDPHDSPLDPHKTDSTFRGSRLTGLLRGLRTYS